MLFLKKSILGRKIHNGPASGPRNAENRAYAGGYWLDE
jgi:hypothetical protein